MARDRALGVGPVGAAFYAWDIGMKRGDIRVLGAASYATPLLSTAFLIMAGFAKPSAAIAVAAVLIAGGGLIAAKDMLGDEEAGPPLKVRPAHRLQVRNCEQAKPDARCNRQRPVAVFQRLPACAARRLRTVAGEIGSESNVQQRPNPVQSAGLPA